MLYYIMFVIKNSALVDLLDSICSAHICTHGTQQRVNSAVERLPIKAGSFLVIFYMMAS